MTSVTDRMPLRYRLPNPPPVFHGREAAAARLGALIARAPLTVVVGPGGIGKSALVSHVLHATRAERADAVLTIGVRPHDALDHVWLDVARVLTTLGGERFGWDGALADPEILAAMAIDLAEAHATTIVVDDLHLGRPDEVPAWLATVARHARHGRWIAISRVDPRLPELAEQTMTLGPLEPHALARIAERCAPDRSPGEIAAAVVAAHGSPYRLRQALVAAAPLEPALGLIELPLSAATLGRLGGIGAHELQRMTDSGAIVTVPGGLRLHDEARAGVLARLDLEGTRVSRNRAIGILAESAGPSAWCETIRLELERSELDPAATHLATHFDTLIAEGLGPRLWELLSTSPSHASRRLLGPRLRLAAVLGRRDDLAWATQLAPPEDPVAWLAWLECALLAGRFDLLDQPEPAGAGPFVSFDAAIVRISALIATSRVDDALEALTALTPLDPEGAATRTMLIARCEVLAGRFDAGLRLAHAVLADAEDLSHDAQAEILAQATALFMNAGQLLAATEAEARLAALAGAYPLSARRGRQRTVRRFTLEVERGHYDKARATLATLRRLVASTTLDQAILAMSDARLSIVTGALEDVEPMVERLIGETRASALAELHAWLLVMRVYLALALGRPEVALPWPSGFPALIRSPSFYLEAYRWIHRLRHAPADPGPAPTLAVGQDASPDFHIIASLVAYEQAQHEDDPARAAGHARDAIRIADEAGWGTFALEARAALCEAHLVEGRMGALRAAVDDLERNARALPSPRYLEVARFFRLAFAPDAARALEAALPPWHVAPEVNRRLGFLLDPRVAVDALDRRVVAALVAAAPALATTTVGGHDGPSWGYDANAGTVWFEDGSTLDLSRHALFGRVLVALAEAGGAIDHEALARAAWGIADYHPLRDAKRIHVAMSRLRDKLEAARHPGDGGGDGDGAASRRIVTGGSGYAVSSAIPFRASGATRRWIF